MSDLRYTSDGFETFQWFLFGQDFAGLGKRSVRRCEISPEAWVGR
ncbi:hypothetical protein COLO4_10048 [Corchorus olitorius]|uniref:Uncharacterized protein n=1 Tax=Corchorus olitorius TaxID=93759 RepID=A0A1R3KA57_9ROSI|nr:hypothetical protein COLO4_10048 [Corchorus olitorius]